MGYRTLAECVDDLRAHGQLVAIDGRDRPGPGDGRHPAAGVRGEGAGGPVPTRQGEPVPERGQPLRDDRAHAVPLPRHPGGGPPAGRAEGQPPCPAEVPLAVPGRPEGGVGPAPAPGLARADPGVRDDARPPAATEVVAGGRRGLRHAPAGLHRGPRPARPGEVEPGDVPGPDLGERVRAEPRGRAALPDPPGDRRPPRRGDPSRRAPAGQRLRGRPPGADGGRGDAAPGGAPRAELRRGPGGPPDRDGRARGGAPDAGRGRLRHRRHGRPLAPQARGAVRRPPRLLQPDARLPGAPRRSRLPPPRGRSGPSPRSAVRRRKTPPSAPSSTS